MSAPTTAERPGAERPAVEATRDERPRRRLSPRARRWLVALVLAVLLALDLARPPAQQLSARFLLASIDVYQATLSHAFGRAGVRCRFVPSCSHYAEGAIRQDGALIGSLRAAWRVARCNPWTPAGTVDPP